MTLRRLILVLAAGVGLVSAGVLSKEAEPAAAKMATAADKLLSSLNADQKAKAQFSFDDKERTNWHFVPYQDKKKKPLRQGLRLEDMTDEQGSIALELIRAGTSPSGFTKATTIMSLENILRELEKNGANERNPRWYFFSVFGTPSKTGKWGWRVEGHHLSLNFTLDGGRVVGATPFFFGANPAEVKSGPRQGLRTLPEAEDQARKLSDSLDNDQRQIALQAKQFPEIQEAKSAAHPGNPVGLAAEKMTDKQRSLLKELIESYTGRMPSEVAASELARLKDAGLEKVYFAIAREDNKPGHPYTYRVQGPTFVIEFLNVQSDSANNPANHIHSAWRDLPGDFGAAVR
jgi:hypothetical protein